MWTPCGRLIHYKIMSIISAGCDFTTPSGGIGNFFAGVRVVTQERLACPRRPRRGRGGTRSASTRPVPWLAEALRRAASVRRTAACPVRRGGRRVTLPPSASAAQRGRPMPCGGSPHHRPLPRGAPPCSSPWHRVHVPGARPWCCRPCVVVRPHASMAPWHLRVAPAVSWSSAMRDHVPVMAASAPPSRAGAAQLRRPPLGSGPLLQVWRASASLGAALGDRPRPPAPLSPASWSPP